jgi:hypothetical protein
MSAGMSSDYSRNVFINCPFDARYRRLFRAIIFAVYDCGFFPRSALEAEKNPQRLSRIIEIIRDCRLAIHDLSRCGVDSSTGLARFNMPFEMGVFIGALHFGSDKQREKNFVMFDRDKHRYQKFISDMNGYDPKPHRNEQETAICNVRDWLSGVDTSKSLMPGGSLIARRFQLFLKELPVTARSLRISTPPS